MSKSVKPVKPEQKNVKIKDLHFDEQNINKGSEYGQSLLEKSLREGGAGRSILVDKNMKIIAGNQTAQKAGELGMEDVIIVPSDGSKLIAVQRTDIDIDSPEGAKMKILDNTVSAKNYVEDAEVAEAICEEYQIDGHSLGLEVERIGDDNEENVSFSAKTKHVIKIELPTKTKLKSALKDINYLMDQKYPDAVVFSKE